MFEKVRENWKQYKAMQKRYSQIFQKPKIIIISTPDIYLKSVPGSIGYYDTTSNTITLLVTKDNVAIRAHEYGHWIIECLYNALTIFWEFLWWGLSIRALFVKGE